MFQSLLRAIWILVFMSFIANGTVFAEISGSLHDFRNMAGNSNKEICIVCHTPHHAGSAVAPLWNHAVSKIDKYMLYDSKYSKTLNASVGQPSPSSKACLSCHDGSVAIDSFGGNTGTIQLSLAISNLGQDLSNDHPISFTFDTTLAEADKGLHNPETKTVGALGKTIKEGMLVDDKVECSSCHDVHKTKGYSIDSITMLVVNNAGSGLCLTCHNK